eukprot:PhF_6_TR39538/c0_g1_i1/m.58638
MLSNFESPLLGHNPGEQQPVEDVRCPPPPLWPPFRETLRKWIFPGSHTVIEFEYDFYQQHHKPPFQEYPKSSHKEIFENIVLLCVAVNTVIVALDRPDGETTTIGKIFEKLEFVFTGIFITEVIIRIACFGAIRQMPPWSRA